MRRLSALLAVVVASSACSSGGQASTPEQTPQAGPSAEPSVGQQIEQTVQGELDGVTLELEVADEPRERAVGLMGRTEVPDGTGMVFLFDELSTSGFYMFQVPVPLVAVFVRDGVVVGVEQMPPCPESEPGDCPTYGPDESYDTVVETAPETLPDVATGDRLELRD